MNRVTRKTRRSSFVVLLVIAVIAASAGTAFAFWSASTNVNASGQAGTLAAPTNFATSSPTATTMGLSWTAPANVTSYTLSQSPGSIAGCSATPTSGTTSCTATGLSGSTSYTWTLRAVFNSWTSAQVQVTASTSAGDVTPPITASVTTPANGSAFRAATVPATFSGSAADNSGGLGLNANTTTFTLQRSTDSFYWTGSAWQAGVANLATTHATTTSNTAAGWTNSATLPTWSSQADAVYTVQATATDKVNNSFTGSASSFTLDKTNPSTALVTSPGNGNVYRAASVPATFTGSAADNLNGAGLNTNTTTFTLQRPDNQYWTGSVWQVAVANLATTHSATTSDTAASWTDNVALPTWSTQPDGLYTVRATATDKAGNTFAGTATTFTLDKTNPITASVTSPTTGSTHRAATAPASFTGSTADNLNGAGLNANSTTFTLQRSSDNNFWSGSAWQVTASDLGTTHSATTSSSAAAWTNSATLPTWASTTDGVYTVQATATDKAGNTLTGTAVTFTLDNTNPITASVTTPANGGVFRTATVPAAFSGSAADNSGGVGVNANTITFTLQRSTDAFYWTGSAWQAGVANLATTHSATTGNSAAGWTDNVALPTWSTDATYTVQAKATDKVGNVFTGTAITFTLDATAPTGSITAPTAASSVGGTTPLTASVSDPTSGGVSSGIATVQFQIKAQGSGSFVNVGTASTNPYTINWDSTTVPNGSTQVQGLVTDNAGNTFTTPIITFTVSNTFQVQLAVAGNKTAGTSFNVNITALAGGVTNTNFTGSKTLSFSGPANSPNGTAPTYPASVTFTNGVATGVPVTLTNVQTVSLAVTNGNISGSTSVTVIAASGTTLSYTSSSNSCSSGAVSLVTNQATWTSKVGISDAFGNLLANGPSDVTLSVTKPGGSGGTLTVPAGYKILANANPGVTANTFSYQIASGNPPAVAITASASGFTSAVCSVDR